LRRTARRHPDLPLFESACAWLFVPFTLWPIDFPGVGEVLRERIARGALAEPELRLLIESLALPPNARTQEVADGHERAVRRGDYEGQVKAGEKYRLAEEQLLEDDAFRAAWAAIKARFDVSAWQDERGIVRRRMVLERGFRGDWQLRWDDPGAQFQAVLDAFCHRWHLYGMAGDRPLLQKVTVNLTPHGTMIFIPSWWSLDSKRDLDWPEIMRLHKPRAPAKQGPKLARNRMARAAEAARAAALEATAKTMGLKGEARARWIMHELGWRDGDPRKLRLVLERARRAKQ
jgi:hypothetical protein